MNHDKLYVDSSNKSTSIDLPQYGSVTLFIQDGKVVRTEKVISEKFDKK